MIIEHLQDILILMLYQKKKKNDMTSFGNIVEEIQGELRGRGVSDNVITQYKLDLSEQNFAELQTKENLGVRREEMPQLKGKDFSGFLRTS